MESEQDQQAVVIAALLTAGSIQQAAEKIGVSEKSIDRLLRTPQFQEEYRLARRRCIDQAVSRIASVAAAAVTTLAAVMVDKKASASAKVAAAGKLLDLAFKSVEVQDMAERLQQLEGLLQDREPGFKNGAAPPYRVP